jgi:prepilin-type processing-associated H-X9-DG protein
MRMAVFYNNSAVSIGEIYDGTTHTFLALELSSQTLPNSAIERTTMFSGGTPYGNPFVFVNHASQGYATFSHSGRRDLSPNDIIYTDQPTRTPRSFHPNGLNAAMCDGSVRFISDTIARAAWFAGFTRNSAHISPGLGGQNAGGGHFSF